MNKPTYLVTGAGGLIGSTLVRHLLDCAQGTVVACDLATQPENLRGVMDRIDYARCDVSSFENVLRVVHAHHPTTIFHLGAMLGPDCELAPQAGIQANAMGTFHVLEAARLFGVTQVIYASSVTVFGGRWPQAKVDDMGLTRPDTVYGAAKLFAENLGAVYRRQHGLDFRSLRMPAVVGPAGRKLGFINYIGEAIEAAMDDRAYSLPVAPDTQVPVVTSAEMARAFVQLASAPHERMRTSNYLVLGATPKLSAQQLVQRLRDRFPRSQLDFQVNPAVQAVFNTMPQEFDDGCARTEWGWEPQHSLEDVIDAYVAARH